MVIIVELLAGVATAKPGLLLRYERNSRRTARRTHDGGDGVQNWKLLLYLGFLAEVLIKFGMKEPG